MNKFESTSHNCAVCGSPVDLFDICEVCGWQDDTVQNNNPDFHGGANDMSLNEAREAYKQGKPIT